MGNRRRLWGFDDEARQLLLDATTEMPELRAVITRAEVRADLGGFLLPAELTSHEIPKLAS